MLWRLPELIDVFSELQSMESMPVVAGIAGICIIVLGFFGRRKGVTALVVVAVAVLKYKLDVGLEEPAAVDMHGWVVVITGGNSGVGFATAAKLSEMGASVVLACRSLAKCAEAAEQIRAAGPVGDRQVHAIQLDLASFSSVRGFVDRFQTQFTQLHVLVNNAGFAQARPGQLTAEGYELGFGSMHLGHFLLTSLLEDVIKRTAQSLPEPHRRSVRVVNVASHGSQVSTIFDADFHPSLFDGNGEGDLRGEKIDSGSFKMYMRAKLANVLFTRELARRWGGDGVVSCSMHVGAVATNVWTTDDMPGFVQAAVNLWSGLFFRSPEQGARTIMQCILGSAEKVQGRYLNGMGMVVQEADLAPPSKDDRLAVQLWEVSQRAVG